MTNTMLLALLLMAWTPPANSMLQYSYLGCYSWDPNYIVSTNFVGNDLAGVQKCRDVCNTAGNAYFGFSNPWSTLVDCHCQDAIAGTPLPDTDCTQSQGVLGSGPFEASNKHVHYSMGSQGSELKLSLYSATDFGLPSPTACVNIRTFRDEKQNKCAHWTGNDCRDATDDGYTAQGQKDILKNCCATCKANCLCNDDTLASCVACLDGISETKACNNDKSLYGCSANGCCSTNAYDVACYMCEEDYVKVANECVKDPTQVDCDMKNAWKLIDQLYSKVTGLEAETQKLHQQVQALEAAAPQTFSAPSNGDNVMTPVGNSFCTLGNALFAGMCMITDGDTSRNSQHAGKWILTNFHMDGTDCEAMCFEF